MAESETDHKKADDIMKNMSGEDREIIKKCWGAIVGSSKESFMRASLMYLKWMFQTFPNVKQHFKFKLEGSSDRAPDVIKHANSIFSAIGKAVELVDDYPGLCDHFKQIAASHKIKGLGPDYFGPLYKGIPSYVQENSGARRSPQEARLMQVVFGVLANRVDEQWR